MCMALSTGGTGLQKRTILIVLGLVVLALGAIILGQGINRSEPSQIAFGVIAIGGALFVEYFSLRMNQPS